MDLFPNLRAALTLAAAWSASLVAGLAAEPSPVTLSIRLPGEASGPARLSSPARPGTLLSLEASTNLSDWQDIATLHDAALGYPAPVSSTSGHTYFRLRSQPRGPADDWKNELRFDGEPFRSAGDREIRWVKFAIPLPGGDRVHYQDSAVYPFHYDFVTRRVTPFVGLDRAALDAVSLRRTNQQVVLGAVLFPPGTNFVEYGVQFVGLDPYPPEDVARWFELVKSTVHAPDGAGALYLPAYEQAEMARTNAAAFAARQIAVASVERWGTANHVYAPGWAFGRLKYFAGSEIAAAFADGRLRPEDILLTDGVPASTPLVAGIISLTPSTPNSHTALLAQSFGIPFVHLPDAADRDYARALAGHQVILRAVSRLDAGLATVLDVEGVLEPSLTDQLMARKQPTPIAYQPKQRLGAFSASTDSLTAADIRHFGGKAANFGLLRTAIPSNSPAAIAFSFDLWDAFMDQPVAGAGTLRGAISNRLSAHTQYPPDMPRLLADLAAVRELIVKSAAFSPELQAAVTNALAGFEATRKIRFRSSTNVEDSETFSGAGLYDSYSGCLLDDLDGDGSGPCHCDPDEPQERGVFRALKKVYASFYNDHAFLERLRRGVHETEVGMAVVVHPSFPDEEELANGVATLRFSFSSFSTSYQGALVSQLGAESVTNPDGAAVPEVVNVYGFGATSMDLTLARRSSRVPLGAHVLEWDHGYREMVGLFRLVGQRFRALNPQRNTVELDFEYKRDARLGPVVKQVREVPRPAGAQAVPAVLIHQPTTWRVAQREAADVFSNHRLKSLLALTTRNLELTGTNLAAGLYADGLFTYAAGGRTNSLGGPLAGWPEASRTADGTINRWTTGAGADRREWSLETGFTSEVPGSEPPILTQRDFTLFLHAGYATARTRVTGRDPAETVTNEVVALEPVAGIPPGSLLQQREATGTGGLRLVTRFYWPDPGDGFAGGYTAPLLGFVDTRITGLTPEPVVLTGYFSQTYRPGHHNFTEEYLFEPGLDPQVPAAVLAELAAADVRLIYVQLGYSPGPIIRTLGFDGKWRDR